MIYLRLKVLHVIKSIETNSSHLYFRRQTLDQVMETMEENENGNMEFPRDVMFEDCFPEMEEPLYGFITNVTVLNDSPCLLNIECFKNGTLIRNSTTMNEDVKNNITGIDEDVLSTLRDFQGISWY